MNYDGEFLSVNKTYFPLFLIVWIRIQNTDPQSCWIVNTDPICFRILSTARNNTVNNPLKKKLFSTVDKPEFAKFRVYFKEVCKS